MKGLPLLLLSVCLVNCSVEAKPGADDAGDKVDGGAADDNNADAGEGDEGPVAGYGWAPQAWEDCEGAGQTRQAGPDDYRNVLDQLEPGDTLQLQAGTYLRGLPLRRSGEEGKCIVIEPLDPNQRPLFMGSNSWNIIAVHGASWLKVRGFDIDGDGKAGFGVDSQGGNDSPSHHVVIEGLSMSGLNNNQQIVGISTKSPVWDWVIRGNTIIGAGTGMYLGNSNGGLPFIRGVVELNTVLDTIGYSMQIKHQNDRPDLPGIPQQAETIIRWNVFSKSENASTGGMARPNLLLGHWPPTGAGADDRYLVYGNFFHDNPTEMLLQAEGNVAIINNVFVNPNGGAITIQPHNDVPKLVDVSLNTVLAKDRGIRVSGGDGAYKQRVRYNAIYAGNPLSAGDEAGNTQGDYAAASAAFASPEAVLGSGLDLHPLAGALLQTIDEAELPSVAGVSRDFDGAARELGVVGAYSTSGADDSVVLKRAARSY